MKTIFFVFVLIIFGLATFAQSPSEKKTTPLATGFSAQDSIRLFYGALFKAFKIAYLHRKAVNWQRVESDVYSRLNRYVNFKKSLNEITPLFDTLKANHCIIYRDGDQYTGTKKKIPKDRYSNQWRKKYDSKPIFEAKILDGKYGYILIPGMVFMDTGEENINRIAQPLYDQIAAIKQSYKIEGWVIDLRMNTGGNCAPMLLSLYDLLGDNTIWGELNLHQRQVSSYKLNQGKYLQKSKVLAAINPTGELLDQAKVAVITGIFTGSSGEIVALAFKGRPNTRFIGEDTSGYTTGNVKWPLPFDTHIALTTSYDSDRNGRYYDVVRPDILVSKLDNFDNLLFDVNIVEAIKFIKGS